MNKTLRTLGFSLVGLLLACSPDSQKPATADPTADTSEATPKSNFTWDNATVYFLLTDRFANGDTSNDVNFERTGTPAPLRGFQGGDFKGITQKIKEGYFNKLGVNAIWMTPFVEQIKGSVDEGTGTSFGFHGYWTRDWTAIDPNFGTEEELAELIQAAHDNGIRIVMDVVINHTGPVTNRDSQWPDEWVRTGPQCQFRDLESTVTCTLVKNLPDIRTESNEPVELPPFLVEKWKKEGRYEQEIQELDAFFEQTGFPRSPRHYIIKWLVDYIKKYGIDGFRVDTVKHTEDYVWGELWQEAVKAFQAWKTANPAAVLDDNEFYMVGEVYNYGISGGLDFDYGDQKVDFFKDGFKSMINFEFKYDANNDYETIFTKYSDLLKTKMSGKTVLNYISSHDDGGPFDLKRERPIEAGTKLLLCPGGVQIYYGDETARTLTAVAQGDATLRAPMNWDAIANNEKHNDTTVRDVLAHWQKLGQFRKAHPSVGAGVHERISEAPYIFKRTYQSEKMEDQVVVGLDLPAGAKTLTVGGTFEDGAALMDYYSGQTVTVENGEVKIDSPGTLVLLGQP